LASNIATAIEQVSQKQELERQNDLFVKAQDIATVGAWEHEPTGEISWTDQVYEIHGLSKEFDPSVEDVSELYHPDDRPKLHEAVERSMTKESLMT